MLAFGLLALERSDRAFEPVREDEFEFLLRPVPVEPINGPTIAGDRNVTAGDLLNAKIFRDKLQNRAVIARFRGVRRIKIQASRRVLEDELRPPRRPRGFPISPLLEKSQLFFQNAEQVVSIGSHRNYPCKDSCQVCRGMQ